MSGNWFGLHRRWVDLPLRGKGLFVVAIPFVPLLLMAVLGYVSGRQADEAEQTVARTLEIKAEIDRTQTLLVEAELGARAYLISRSAEARDNFNAATAALPSALARLGSLVQDPEQLARLKALPAAAQARPLSSIIEYVDRTTPGAPMPLDLLQRSRATMAELRRQLQDMQHAEDVLLEARSSRARGARRRALAATGGGVMLGLTGGIIAALLFTSGIGRRITVATDNARRLAAGEPFAPMPMAWDEVGALGASLSAAADLLRQRNELLQRRMDDLRTANAELESFSYSISHDLRAPLRHIAGFATLLDKRAGDTLDPEAARYLRTIVDSAARMGRLVDDLLAFSRMGRSDMRGKRVDLDEVMHEAVQEVSQDTGGRQINWTTHPLPSVVGDPVMLRYAFVNLLSNAVKYTGTRAVAEIEIGEHPAAGGERVVFVRDNGVGFDMAYVDKLFGVFQRLHGADQFAGTGIGLASVRRIVERHGGRTWAEGTVGHGATFFVSLPEGVSAVH